MARRHKYTASDRARVFAELSANNGNVKRTARHTSIPISTVRDWKVEWQQGGVDIETIDALPAVVTDFVQDATRVRDKLLIRLEELADKGDITAREIVPALGMLTDKIRAYKGLDAVKEHRHTIEIPQMVELESNITSALAKLVSEGQKREQEIHDVIELEPSKYKELQPATEE